MTEVEHLFRGSPSSPPTTVSTNRTTKAMTSMIRPKRKYIIYIRQTKSLTCCSPPRRFWSSNATDDCHQWRETIGVSRKQLQTRRTIDDDDDVDIYQFRTVHNGARKPWNARLKVENKGFPFATITFIFKREIRNRERTKATTTTNNDFVVSYRRVKYRVIIIIFYFFYNTIR